MNEIEKKKLLLVSYSADYGSRTLTKLMLDLFRNRVDLIHHEFSHEEFSIPTRFSRMRYFRYVAWRTLKAVKLWPHLREAEREDRKILFVHPSPAVFGFPATRPNSTFLITDWNRKLHEPLRDRKLSPRWLTALHRRVFTHTRIIFCLTDAVKETFRNAYGVPDEKLKRVKVPFSPSRFLKFRRPISDTLKLLFVGRNFQAKGGHVLVDWFLKKEPPGVHLTLVTGSLPMRLNGVKGISVVTDLHHGDPRHSALLEDHDIFVLPTRYDAFPMALGEAASAGLALLTTKNALGAPEVIRDGENGFICQSDPELLKRLEILLQNRSQIVKMKQRSRELMMREFDSDSIFQNLCSQIFGTEGMHQDTIATSLRLDDQ